MSIVVHLHKAYIKDTPKKAIVQLVQVHLCHLTIAVTKGIDMACNKVYLSTRVLKHVYDKRTAEEYDFMIGNLWDIIKYPSKIYKNKNGKRGCFLFMKEIADSRCVVSIETIIGEKKTATHCDVATFFRTDDNYLRNYELLWEWKGGTPSS